MKDTGIHLSLTDMEKGLYIHIPFCIKKCIYCDFYSVSDYELIEEYIDAIEKEIVLKKEDIKGTTTVYIGGGTPTILDTGLLEKLFDIILKNIDIERVKEITIEANPGTLNKEKIRVSKDHGVTRFSLGIQSMNENELKILKRSHTVEDNIKAMELVKKSGIDLSIDLIYGVPGQEIVDWQKTLNDAIIFGPVHLSTYELTITEGTELHRMVSEKKFSKPQEDTIINMYYCAIEYLEDIGFNHYEVSNFSMPGHECIHNINYWKCGEYLGIGAGAHSYYGGARIENIPDIKGYINHLKDGKNPPERVIHIDKKDRIIEYLMLGLRMMEGIKVSRIDEKERGKILEKSSILLDKELIMIDGDSLRITKKGIPLLNEIILRLMDGIY